MISIVQYHADRGILGIPDGASLESDNRRASVGTNPSHGSTAPGDDDAVHYERLLRRGKECPVL